VVNKSLKDWRPGDKIVITSYDVNEEGLDTCIEESEILRIEGVFMSLNDPLRCFHAGGNTSNDIPNSHVASLSRNVIIKSEDGKNRGSVNFFHGSTGDVKYAEFRDLGPKNTLGRYPIHFHQMHDTSKGIEVVGNSIINSENRWITVHDSNGVTVTDNVGYRSVGHGFFLEGGLEFDNIFENNIGITTFGGGIIPSDFTASVFWSQNPMNTFRNNVAVNGHYYGYYFLIPDRDIDAPGFEKKVNLRSLPGLIFEDNISYNSRQGGLRIDRVSLYDEDIGWPEFLISNFHVYNNFFKGRDQAGIFIQGDDIKISNSKIVNSLIGIDIKGDRNIIDETYIKGQNYDGKPRLMSGIVIAGENNVIKTTTIEGYVPDGSFSSSDISISNSLFHKNIISASVIDSKLLDPRPIIFGFPANTNSFLEVYGYEDPNEEETTYPTDFILRRLDYYQIHESKNDFIIDLNFLATIEPLDESKPSLINTKEISELKDSRESLKTEQIRIFKNKAQKWKDGIINDIDFLEEIKILFETNVIQSYYVDSKNFVDYNIEIPYWVKSSIDFWMKDSVSDEEFLNALKYIIELQIKEFPTGKSEYN